MEWLKENHPNFIVDVNLFKIKDSSVFPKTLFKDEMINIGPHKWWAIMRSKSLKD
jgi:hypothetical protein